MTKKKHINADIIDSMQYDNLSLMSSDDKKWSFMGDYLYIE